MAGAPSGDDPSEESARLPAMTHYVLGLYRRVPGRPELPDPIAARIQEGHLRHLRSLRESGELLASGPFEEDGDFRGIVLFTHASKDRARASVATDPAIIEGRLTLDLFTWFGPAGLQVVPYRRAETDLDFASD